MTYRWLQKTCRPLKGEGGGEAGVASDDAAM